MNRRILVIGGSGFIGARVGGELVADCEVVGSYHRNREIRLQGSDLHRLDVTHEKSVLALVSSIRPDVIVLACGTQSIEGCAGINGAGKEAMEAWQVHVDGTTHVAEACRRHGCRLAYVSTDCVFSGEKALYSEADVPDPFNAYGAMKRRAEEIVESVVPEHVIMRVSLAYGWRQHPDQFHNFSLRVLDRLERDESPVKAATNLFNTPLEITDAARAISRIAVGADNGVFHVASHERISRFEFARRVAEIFGHPVDRIVPVEDTSGLRPPNSCLSAEKAAAALSMRFDGLEAGLVRMKRQRPSAAA